jgi:hypothetical protein
MTSDSLFVLMCGGLIALLFSLAVTFLGYRLFIVLLPIWGFVFGLALGAQTLQVLFGTGFLSTVTSWIVGFFTGALFAVLSYLFYVFAIALISGSLGYTVAVGLLTAIGIQMNLLNWVIGLVAAVALIFITFKFDLQRWVIIIATSVLGAAAIAGTIGLLFNPTMSMVENPVRVILSTSPLLAITAIVVAIAGIIVQARSTGNKVEIEYYNRWE